MRRRQHLWMLLHRSSGPAGTSRLLHKVPTHRKTGDAILLSLTSGIGLAAFAAVMVWHNNTLQVLQQCH